MRIIYKSKKCIKIIYNWLFKKMPLKDIYFGKNCHIISNKTTKKTIESKFHMDENGFFYNDFEAELRIGKNFYINRNGYIACSKKIIIGDNVTIGPNCIIIDSDHDFYSTDRKNNYIKGEILIGSNVWIGANCTILKNVKIGDNAVISAGCVVSKDVPANTILIQKKECYYKTIK